MVEDFQKGLYKDGKRWEVYVPMAPDKVGSDESFGEHMKSITESFRRHVNAYLSTPATFYRGGLNYIMVKKGNDIIVEVYDTYSIASMITRNDNDNIKRNPNSVTPLGNTTVVFKFTWKDVNFKQKRRL